MVDGAGLGVRFGVIAAITLLSAVWAAPAPAAKTDLAVTSVTGAPATALTGEAPTLKVTVKNLSRRKSKPADLFAQVVGESGAVVSAKFGKGSVGPIAARKTRTVSFRPKVPYEAIGQWRLGVCVAPGKAANDCAQTGVVDFSDGSTVGRIDAALDGGELTEGEALLYKLYALSSDDGLPDAYDGGGPMPSGVVLADLVSAFATLSLADQALVAPYMLQPRYAQSAWAPEAKRAIRAAPRPARRGASDPCSSLTEVEGAWTSVESAHAHFWYRPGNATAQAKAQSLSAAFEAKIWPDLTGAFMEVDDFTTAICDPLGDPKIDFYLESGNALLIPGAGGVAPGLWLGGPCGPNTSFVVLPQNATRSTVAHEFMHVIQWAYPVCQREPAWVEGTAAWAENYVYEDDNAEHTHKGSLEQPFFSLRDPMLNYDSWPFWYSLEVNDDVDAIVRVFEALATTNFAGALEQGPSDGLEEAWKRYSVERWNQVPIGSAGFPLTQSFKQADGFTAKPGGVPSVDVALGGLPEKPFPLPTALDQRPLSTEFQRVKVKDPAIRELEFENGDDGAPGTIVQAFLKLENGNWRLEDWSDKSTVKLCRDKDDENVVEMIVATSNATATGSPLGPANHLLTARDICEQPTYSGTYSGTSRLFDNSGNDQFDMTADFNGMMTLAPYDGPGASGHEWKITTGSLTVSSYDGTMGECSVTGGGQTFTLPATNAEGAPAMALVAGRYYVNIPWVSYFPPQNLAIQATGPPEDCDNLDEWPIAAVGQYLTLTPLGIEPDENGALSITNLDDHSDPNWFHDDFQFTFTPLP